MKIKALLKPIRYVVFLVMWTIRIPLVAMLYLASTASVAAFLLFSISPVLLGREMEDYGFYLLILGVAAVVFAAVAFIYDVILILINPAPVTTFLGH